MTVIVDLILHITRFPKQGLVPSQYFHRNHNNKRLDAKIKKKYELENDGCLYVVDNINEQVVHIVARIISCKVLWKNRSNQYTLGVVPYTKQCAT